MSNKVLIVIGAGAAGFFAAINAAQNHPNLSVIILEKTSKVLQKVKVSGGGRCNVTNHCFAINELIANYPRGSKELQQAFNQFAVADTISWFERNNVELHTEQDNRMFPASNSSQTIITCFENLANKLGIKIYLNNEVTDIDKVNNQFELQLKSGNSLKSDYLIVTSGGYNQITGYNFLSSFNLQIDKPIPSLFTFNIENKSITELMGLSVPNAVCKINNSNFEFEGPLLITHWGFSGPAILKLSAFAAQFLHDLNYNFEVQINWNSDYSFESLKNDFLLLKNTSNKVWSSVHKDINLPQRLFSFLLHQCQIDPLKKLAETSNKSIDAIVNAVYKSNFKIKGKTTFKEEFVTCGGIQLKEINFKTMGSKKVEGLYFAGEILNIDGITGGFNFQAAWTTAFIAAKLNT